MSNIMYKIRWQTYFEQRFQWSNILSLYMPCLLQNNKTNKKTKNKHITIILSRIIKIRHYIN